MQIAISGAYNCKKNKPSKHNNHRLPSNTLLQYVDSTIPALDCQTNGQTDRQTKIPYLTCDKSQ